MSNMHAFVLDQSGDPEESLENALLHSALKRHFGESLVAYTSTKDIPLNVRTIFGRMDSRYLGLIKREGTLAYPTVAHLRLDYWTDPAFLAQAGRRIELHDLDGARRAVDAYHAEGKNAFVKGTKSKSFTQIVPVGTSLIEALDGLEYSLCDAGPCLLVQDAVDLTSEYRLFVVDGQVVTGAGCIESNTPANNLDVFDTMIEGKRNSGDLRQDPDLAERYRAFAENFVKNRPALSCTFDVGLVDGEIAIIEMNPLYLGRVGLFACSVEHLVDAVVSGLDLNARAAA